jgi:hypothetical protein
VWATALAAALPLACLLAPRQAHADAPPAMDYNKPSSCLEDGKGMRWRVQCDAGTKVCLYAPESELDDGGNRIRPLERVPDCEGTGLFDQEALTRDGYRLVPGLPPTPYGWYRDRYGKIFQFNFDLHRRLYVGGAWAPEYRDGTAKLGRSLIDFGLLEYQSFTDERNPTRHRLRIVEGEVRLAPFTANGYLLRYDVSHRRQDPLFRLTTFFGEPRRSDYKMNLGIFLEAVGLEAQSTPQGNVTLWRYGTGHLTFDLWQSSDMYSYLRVRGGAALERILTENSALPDRSAFTPGGAIDADFTLDANGFHHIVATGSVESPQFFAQRSQDKRSSALRGKGEISYEVIALAINDQPISLRFATSAGRRDDLPGYPDGWVFTSTAGLRLSLWAPARDR